MKIAQVAAALPSLSPAAPRLTEGAMLFELPVVSGDGGSGAAALDHDATDTGQPADKLVAADGSADIGSIVADGAAVRQMPPLPVPTLPPVVARTQPSLAPEAPTVAPATASKLPDPRAGTATPPTIVRAGAPLAPESTRVPATEASIVAQPVATPLAPPVIAETPVVRSRDAMQTASAIPPADRRQIEQGMVALPHRMAAAPMPFLAASGRPMDTLVQPKLSETPLPQPAVAGRVALSDVAQQVAGGQTPAPSLGTVRETVEATPNRATVEQAVPAPMPTANRIEAAPIDVRIAPLRLEPVVAERPSNGGVAPEPLVDTSPVAIVRQMGGEAVSTSLSSGRVGSPKPRQIEAASYPTGPAAPLIGQSTRPSRQERGPLGGGAVSSQSSLSNIDPVAAPLDLAPATNTPILSGMTRSVDAVAAPSATTLPILDVDAGGQWIDRLAVEISACAATGGVRLKLSPDNLGELSIAVSNGDSGASVTITAQDEGVRSAIAGAQDRLMAEARAQGVRVADLQTGLAGDNGSSPQQQHRSATQAMVSDRFNQPKRSMGQEVANHERANPVGRWA